jgi:hypothetical protein
VGGRHRGRGTVRAEACAAFGRHHVAVPDQDRPAGGGHRAAPADLRRRRSWAPRLSTSSTTPRTNVTESDGQFCVAITSGAVSGHHVALGRCVGTAAYLWTASTWITGMDLTTQQSFQYREIHTEGVSFLRGTA